MRRVLFVTALAATGLLGAGIAAGALLDNGTTTKVAPTFTLTVSNVDAAKCDGGDGSYTTDQLSATGRIGGGPLAGTADLDLTWVKNTTENAGYAEGTLVVSSNDEEKARGDVIGAVTGTTLRGTVSGTVGDGTERLIGTISIVRNAKSLAVKIGNGSVAGAAIVVADAACRVPETATGEVIDIDLESGYVSIETEDGDYVTVDLTEKQAAAIKAAGIDVGERVTITYVETDEGSSALVTIKRA